MKRFFFTAFFLLIFFGQATAQVPASVIWPLTDPATGGTGFNPVNAGPVTGSLEQFVNTEINQYTGFSTSQRVRIVGNTWPASRTTPIDTVYIQFVVTPFSGGTFTAQSIAMNLAAAGGSNMRAAVSYSTDSTFASSTQVFISSASLPQTAFTAVSAPINVEVTSGKSIYVRVSMWWHNQTSSLTGKYLCIQNVVVSGTAPATSVSLPVLSTAAASNISTTFAASGGTITSDGGGAVATRGICWNTSGTPDTSDNKILIGSGSGSFNGVLTNLTAATEYHVRAFAINSAGIAYGNVQSFTTLAQRIAPTLTTTGVSSILTTTANSGGNVTAWGGDTISARGLCWNTSGNPTILDNITVNGAGMGSFVGTMTGLAPHTQYHVRAYATNGIGTGYGSVLTFTTQTPAPDVTKIVSQDGSGDYMTVQEAFNAVPEFYTGKYVIYVKKGIYKEKLLLTQNKIHVILVGEDRDSTILTYDDYAGKSGGTSTSYSVAIDADDFTAMHITFQNTIKNDGSFADQQAVALRVNGDRQAYYDCNIMGYQDTYYTWGGRGTGRTYHKNCYIEGSVDFIFGRNIVVFDSCTINVNRNNGTLTAASTEATSKFGYVFLNSVITSDSVGFDGNVISTFSLGRPWQASPRTVFLHCKEPANLNASGWLAWNVTPGLYAEYQCYGPGFKPAQRVAWSSQLSDSAAAAYTIENIFSKNSVSPAYGADWIPVKPIVSIPVSVGKESNNIQPREFRLEQNYPNPFNPSTTLSFSVGNEGKTILAVYTMLGQMVATLFDDVAVPGKNYSVRFTAEQLSSGLYMARLYGGGSQLSRKMILMK